MPDRDYYDVLGISRSATADDIKRAYRKLAKKYHPDHNENDASAEARFKELQEAYGVLSDANSRGQYDQFGRAGAASGGGGPHVTWTTGGGDPIDVEELSDLFDFSFVGGPGGREQPGGSSIFDQFFQGRQGGRRRSRPGPQAGEDIEHHITLAFEQAFRGVSVDVERSKVTVRVPPGVRDGQRIRLRSQGGAGRHGGPPGDLFIACHVTAHAFFERREDDVYLDLPISLDEAALGAKIDLPTLDGVRTVTVPAGTASGTKLRLAGLGMPKSNGERGHQYAVIKIVPPGSLTDTQASLMAEFAKTRADSPREGLWP